MQARPPLISLICSSCSSGRDFASGFLQIPPHEGYPCLWLTLPTAKCVRVFHPIVIAHAGRTYKVVDNFRINHLISFFILIQEIFKRKFSFILTLRYPLILLSREIFLPTIFNYYILISAINHSAFSFIG